MGSVRGRSLLCRLGDGHLRDLEWQTKSSTRFAGQTATMMNRRPSVPFEKAARCHRRSRIVSSIHRNTPHEFEMPSLVLYWIVLRRFSHPWNSIRMLCQPPDRLRRDQYRVLSIRPRLRCRTMMCTPKSRQFAAGRIRTTSKLVVPRDQLWVFRRWGRPDKRNGTSATGPCKEIPIRFSLGGSTSAKLGCRPTAHAARDPFSCPDPSVAKPFAIALTKVNVLPLLGTDLARCARWRRQTVNLIQPALRRGVSASVFQQYTSLPANMASIAILACQ